MRDKTLEISSRGKSIVMQICIVHGESMQTPRFNSGMSSPWQQAVAGEMTINED